MVSTRKHHFRFPSPNKWAQSPVLADELSFSKRDRSGFFQIHGFYWTC